ncbi:hypothetical protein EIP91_000699 [Steccherinum ochraceum]|uniref:Uncharacterized protein n=1 Tax=Steccherinum ochraceum TaxID=92696 RepID=A0A4R0RFA6_9APHY|nr:hypothetical protein EIP91_000699 [Steccherinum ochraceum]
MATETTQLPVELKATNPRFRLWFLAQLFSLVQKDKLRWDFSPSNPDQSSVPEVPEMKILNFLAFILSRNITGDDRRDLVVAILATGLTVGENNVTVMIAEPTSSIISHDRKDETAEERNAGGLLSPPKTALGTDECPPIVEYSDYLKTVIDLLLRCAHSPKGSQARRDEVQNLTRVVVSQRLHRLQFKARALKRRYFQSGAPSNLLELPYEPAEFKFKFDPPSAWRTQTLSDMIEAGYTTQKPVPGSDSRYFASGSFFIELISEHVSYCSECAESDIDSLVKSMYELRKLLKAIPEAFWKSPTLVGALSSVKDVKEDEENDRNKDYDSTVASELNTGSLIPDVQDFVRQLDALTAPTTAIKFLVNKRIFQTSLEFSINLVNAPHPCLGPGNLIEEGDILLSEWQAGKRLTEQGVRTLRQMINESNTLEKPFALSGSCHCEATLMAKVHADSRGNHGQSSPFSIGVSKKCCPLCWELGNVLCDQHNLNVTLLGHNGVYAPWVPPPGLSDTVLNELELVLLERLKTKLGKDKFFLGSRHTSPGSSSSEDQTSSDETPSIAGRVVQRKLKAMKKAAI